MSLIGDRKHVKPSKQEGNTKMMTKKTHLLTVVLCKLVEESASLLRLEISQHGSDDGADVF